MAENIFVRAKAYQALHPRTSWADCIQKVKSKKSPAKKSSAAVSGTRKKAHKAKAPVKSKVAANKVAAPRKIKVKIKPGKKGQSQLIIGATKHQKTCSKISGMNNDRFRREQGHLSMLESSLAHHKDRYKEVSTRGEKAAIMRDIRTIKDNIAKTKLHIRSLKKLI